jgi:hypothetical protein
MKARITALTWVFRLSQIKMTGRATGCARR